MKKLLYLLIIVLLASLISCGNKPSQLNKKAPVPQKIQRSFYGMTLGKTKLTQGEDILLKNGINYQVVDGFGEIALDVIGPMTFGEVQWEFEEFVFTNNVLYQVSFMIDSTSVNFSKTERASICKKLLNNLKKKYPKYKITKEKVTDTETDTNFKAADKWCHVYLSYSNDNYMICLMYSINSDKINKLIPSDL